MPTHLRHGAIGCLGLGMLGLGHCSQCSPGSINSSSVCACGQHASATTYRSSEATDSDDVFATQPVVETPTRSPVSDDVQAEVQPAPADAEPIQVDSSSSGVTPHSRTPWSVPDEVAPPTNPLPSNPAPLPPEPSSATGAASDSGRLDQPPLPPRFNFAGDPPVPGEIQVKTISAPPNSGTARLLHQLQTR